MSQQTGSQIPNGATIPSQAFSELHDQYRGRLLKHERGFPERDDAEDIMATAFAAAFKKRDRFRGEASPHTWLYSIAMNEARSRRRGVPLESIERSDAMKIAEPDSMDRANSKNGSAVREFGRPSVKSRESTGGYSLIASSGLFDKTNRPVPAGSVGHSAQPHLQGEAPPPRGPVGLTVLPLRRSFRRPARP